jgi:hypothetical protein
MIDFRKQAKEFAAGYCARLSVKQQGEVVDKLAAMLGCAYNAGLASKSAKPAAVTFGGGVPIDGSATGKKIIRQLTPEEREKMRRLVRGYEH